jgi:hypothetical protein
VDAVDADQVAPAAETMALLDLQAAVHVGVPSGVIMVPPGGKSRSWPHLQLMEMMTICHLELWMVNVDFVFSHQAGRLHDVILCDSWRCDLTLNWRLTDGGWA